jgi:hypothetical protein
VGYYESLYSTVISFTRLRCQALSSLRELWRCFQELSGVPSLIYRFGWFGRQKNWEYKNLILPNAQSLGNEEPAPFQTACLYIYSPKVRHSLAYAIAYDIRAIELLPSDGL